MSRAVLDQEATGRAHELVEFTPRRQGCDWVSRVGNYEHGLVEGGVEAVVEKH